MAVPPPHKIYSHINPRSLICLIRNRQSAPATSPSVPVSPVIPIGPSNDVYNYILLIILYTLQGIPMGLSASVPFFIQKRVKSMATNMMAITNSDSPSVSQLSYNAQAIFSLCSWPFSLKIFWAPLVDALYIPYFGRRKSWLIPVQTCAGLMMVFGSNYIDSILSPTSQRKSFPIEGITIFFFTLYLLTATQDIALDGWALTILSPQNRKNGPICNCIGQNLGYLLAFTGFLALNDVDTCEDLWRPMLRLQSRPGHPFVTLKGFLQFMGLFMLCVTWCIAFLKEEGDSSLDILPHSQKIAPDNERINIQKNSIGSTYKQLWSVCQLPVIKSLSILLLTFRFPTSLTDNVKYLQAVEWGLSKESAALLSPTIILPLGIFVPVIAAKIWNGQPMRQFMDAYKVHVTLVGLLDISMLWALRYWKNTSTLKDIITFSLVVLSTSFHAVVRSLQLNAQMMFFAKNVDANIGGSYMTLLNTINNLGGSWPAPVIMYLMGRLTIPPKCTETINESVCTGGRHAYFPLQFFLSACGCIWIYVMNDRVKWIESRNNDAWRVNKLAHHDQENPLCNEVNCTRGKMNHKKSI